MAGKLPKDKDTPRPIIDCGDCIGENPQKGNPTCAGCPLRQKCEAEMLVSSDCDGCLGATCTIQDICDETSCLQLGIPCCKKCLKNRINIAM